MLPGMRMQQMIRLRQRRRGKSLTRVEVEEEALMVTGVVDPRTGVEDRTTTGEEVDATVDEGEEAVVGVKVVEDDSAEVVESD